MLHHALGLLVQPRQQWQQIAAMSAKNFNRQIPYCIILALLPALAWYFGTTKIGWRIGDAQHLWTLTSASALPLAAVFYLTMIFAIVGIGFLMHWMARTYGAQTHLLKAIVVAGFAATPIFIAGIAGFYPLMWFDILLATLAAAYAVYLLYLGIPIVFDVPTERGFLFASAIIAACLVVGVLIMVATVLYWAYVAEPVFQV